MIKFYILSGFFAFCFVVIIIIFRNLKKLITQLGADVGNVIERMDKKDFRNNLENQLQNKANTIVAVKNVDNNELKHLVFNGVTQYNNLIKNIFSSDFKIEINELRNIAENLLKIVKFHIDKNKIGTWNVELFLRDLEIKVINPNIDKFLIKYLEVRDLVNGQRMREFAALSINFVTNIIEQSIDLYNEFK